MVKTGEHSSPLRLKFLSMIKNLHPNKRLPCLKGGGPRQRWMSVEITSMAKNNNVVGQGLAPAVWCKIQSMVKTGEHSSPLRLKFLSMIKKLHANKRLHLYCRAGACSCRLVWNLIVGRANTVRPYDWIFYHLFEIRTPTMPSPLRRRGTAPAVVEVLKFNGWHITPLSCFLDRWRVTIKTESKRPKKKRKRGHKK